MTSATPIISIITVVYNASETLEHTIRSVVNQSYSNVEYIIVDGGSTDGTLDIINAYRDNISQVVSEKDQGIYDAMNKGLDLATGDWVYFLGADDLLLSITVIEELVSYFVQPDAIYYGDTYLKTRNKMYEGEVGLLRLSLCNISHQAIFYPRSVYKSKKYDIKYRFYADHVYNLELFAQQRDKFRYIPKLISVYNDLGRSSTIKDIEYAADIVSIIYRNFGLPLTIYVWLRRKIARIKNKVLRRKPAYI